MAGAHARLRRERPAPLPGLRVDECVADESPDAVGGTPEASLARPAGCVQEADERLGLHPPDGGLVPAPACRVVALAELAPGADTLFEADRGQPRRDGVQPAGQHVVAERLDGIAQQPARLDVVTERDSVRKPAPFRIEIESEMAVVGDDPVREQFEAVTQRGCTVLVRCDPVHRGHRLHEMQMRVHRLRRVHVVCAEPHVLDRTPVAGEGFDESSAVVIRGVCRDDVEIPFRVRERRGVGRRAVVGDECVDAEALRVGLLAIRDDLAARGQRPQGAAVAAVLEALREILVRPFRRRRVAGLARETQHLAEEPEQPAVKDEALAGVGDCATVRVDLSDEAAVAFVRRVREPPAAEALQLRDRRIPREAVRLRVHGDAYSDPALSLPSITRLTAATEAAERRPSAGVLMQ